MFLASVIWKTDSKWNEILGVLSSDKHINISEKISSDIFTGQKPRMKNNPDIRWCNVLQRTVQRADWWEHRARSLLGLQWPPETSRVLAEIFLGCNIVFVKHSPLVSHRALSFFPISHSSTYFFTVKYQLCFGSCDRHKWLIALEIKGFTVSGKRHVNHILCFWSINY
jgi:hypothetical protein